VKKRTILSRKTFEGRLYRCAAPGGAHGLFGGCPFLTQSCVESVVLATLVGMCMPWPSQRSC